MLMVTSKCRKLINPQKCAMEVFYVLCKSKPIQYVKLNQYPLRRNDRDRRILLNGGLQILARATAENFIRGDKLHRDCDSRWVADSALEVFIESPTSILQKTSAVVYKAHIWILSTVG